MLRKYDPLHRKVFIEAADGPVIGLPVRHLLAVCHHDNVELSQGGFGVPCMHHLGDLPGAGDDGHRDARLSVILF